MDQKSYEQVDPLVDEIAEQISDLLETDAFRSIKQKLAAIKCYQSQFIQGRSQNSPTMIDQLRDEAAYWGRTIGAAYGEPFASREPIGLKSMATLF